MKRWVMLCAALLVVPAAVCAQNVVRERPVVLRLDVNRSGVVTAAKVMPPAKRIIVYGGRQAGISRPYGSVPEALAKAAVQVASKWRFRPPEVDGRPVSGRTWAHANLQIVKRGNGKFGIDLRYEYNGPYIQSWVLPEFPKRMLRLKQAFAVVTEAVVQPDGSVADVHVLKVLAEGRGSHRQIERVTRRALVRWKGMAMKVDGKTVATRLRIPFIFSWPGSSKANVERLERQVHALIKPTKEPGKNDGPVRSGVVVALDNPFVKQPSS